MRGSVGATPALKLFSTKAAPGKTDIVLLSAKGTGEHNVSALLAMIQCSISSYQCDNWCVSFARANKSCL